MAVKVISVFLTLSYLFLGILGYLPITEKEFRDFKGTDPTIYCENLQAMEKFCNDMKKFVKNPQATGAFANGYPSCRDKKIKADKNSGGGTVVIETTVVVCNWHNPYTYYTFGKGKTSNYVMRYETIVSSDDHYYLVFDQEYPYCIGS